MTTWQRHLIDNPAILSNFILDMEERITRTTKEGVKASKEGNFNSANSLFGKAEAYESLKDSTLILQKERDTQDAFQSAQSGKRTNSRTKS